MIYVQLVITWIRTVLLLPYAVRTVSEYKVDRTTRADSETCFVVILNFVEIISVDGHISLHILTKNLTSLRRGRIEGEVIRGLYYDNLQFHFHSGFDAIACLKDLQPDVGKTCLYCVL